ncbi:hypothetical protein CSKR_104576 [Clonorchis sinensis]|uniref:Uncharacterized protein n=1 Tax=Clonorchis sinensis TaxID=79923 RepID=A0A3R7JH79_CLOSI|nr:hypothetical protein CSKR_104576 [Clonorchis sinensis]
MCRCSKLPLSSVEIVTSLLQNNTPFVWSEQEAFKPNSDCLRCITILTYADISPFNFALIQDTGASERAIRSVLSQRSCEALEIVVALTSRSLSHRGKRYRTVKHPRHYLLGRWGLVQTDDTSPIFKMFPRP